MNLGKLDQDGLSGPPLVREFVVKTNVLQHC